MRQFVNLPLGAALMSEFDQFVLQFKRDRLQFEQLEVIHRQLVSKESSDMLCSKDKSQLCAHFSGLKSSLLGIVANSSEEFATQHLKIFDACADVFDNVASQIGSICATKLDEALFAPMSLVLRLAERLKESSERYRSTTQG